MELSTIEQLGFTKISESKPGGINARSGETFEALKNEVKKLDDLSGSTVDWSHVIDLSIKILSKESKDLLVASYLCVGLLHVRKFRGLKSGLICYRGLFQNFWDSMTPPVKKVRRRAEAVSWLAERLQKEAARLTPEKDERSDIVICTDEIESLHTFFYELFQSTPVNLMGLKKVLKDHLLLFPEPDQTLKKDIPQEIITSEDKDITHELTAPSGDVTEGDIIPEQEEVVSEDALLSDVERLGTDPIRPDAPSGDNVRYNPSFEELDSEIQKLSALSGGIVNWQKVIDLSKDILSKESKDLLIASFLCVGLFHVKGYTGLKEGIVCYQGLLKNFWDTLFPPLKKKKAKARVSAVMWLSEQMAKYAQQKEPETGERQVLTACVEAIDALHEVLYEKFPDDPVSLTILKEEIQKYLSRMPEEKEHELPKEKPQEKIQYRDRELKDKPEEEKIREKSTEDTRLESPSQPLGEMQPSAQLDIPVVDTSGPLESDQDASRILNDLNMGYRTISHYFYEKDKSNPLSYRISRFVVWLEIDTLPVHENYITRVPPVEDYTKERVKTLIDNNYWEALLDFAENNINEYPLWIDLNYFSSLSLSRLGSVYKQAEQMINDETAQFLRRQPELMNLHFSDGTPFANNETRNWLDSVMKSYGSGASDKTASLMSEKMSELKDSATSLVIEKKHKDALVLLKEGLDETFQARERFYITLEMAKIYLDAQRPKGALGLLETLEAEVKRFSLHEWDPPLAYETLYLMWRTLAGLREISDEGQLPDIQSRIDDLYHRLCSLNPVSAFDLSH
jgi:type VI secretion system ImpA/VasJ family protein